LHINGNFDIDDHFGNFTIIAAAMEIS